MSKVRFVGLDVHKDSITIAVADQDGLAPQVVATVPHELRALLKQLKKLSARNVSTILRQRICLFREEPQSSKRQHLSP
jgi:hypothetical protein